MFWRYADCTTNNCNSYFLENDTIYVHRHRFTWLSDYISQEKSEALYLYPSEEFAYMHVYLKFVSDDIYTWKSLKKTIRKHIKEYTWSDWMKVRERNWLIDDIYINAESSSILIWCVGNIQCRIKFWALKKSSSFPNTKYLVPRELWLVQRFSVNNSWMLILDVSETTSKCITIENYRMSAIKTLNIWLWDMLCALRETCGDDLEFLFNQSQSNDIAKKLIYRVLDTYIVLYSNWLWDKDTPRVLIQWQILHYPELVQYFIEQLSKESKTYVGLYIWSDLDIPGRKWSSDEVCVMTTMHYLSTPRLLSSFSTPTR